MSSIVNHKGGGPLAPLIDTHIHLDSYPEDIGLAIAADLANSEVQSVISVSMNLPSCKRNLELARLYNGGIRPAFGYHPEQPLPSATEIQELLQWMEVHSEEMVAVGEVGLPYYTRLEAATRGEAWDDQPYVELLETFIAFAAKHKKPVILHAVYEDAEMACDLLERYSHPLAHFHWFKGAEKTLQRMAEQGYYISFTPDIVYEEEIRRIALGYPEHLVMSETDGPWPFEGPFTGQTTHPRMTSSVASAWAELRGISLLHARKQLYDNAARLYGI